MNPSSGLHSKIAFQVSVSVSPPHPLCGFRKLYGSNDAIVSLSVYPQRGFGVGANANNEVCLIHFQKTAVTHVRVVVEPFGFAVGISGFGSFPVLEITKEEHVMQQWFFFHDVRGTEGRR
mmetsp:Transcript_20397/g.52254  ORF Transcript_20397/g.52254 Transcript_20397/m.52254 type:complete len:120 (+) Transcript_20397:2452-2811(+)